MQRAQLLDEVLAVLRAHANELRERGIARMAVFGSVARGEEGVESDVDIVVDLDRAHIPDVFAYVGIELDVAKWVGRPVHLAVREGLRPYIRPVVERDAVYAF